MKKIAIYIAESYASVEIQNGASRITTAADMGSIVAAMHPDDRIVLAQTAAGILRALETAAPALTAGGAR